MLFVISGIIVIFSFVNNANNSADKATLNLPPTTDIVGVAILLIVITSLYAEFVKPSTSEIDLVYGTGFNIELQGELIVTVIATGFDSNKVQEATVVAEEEVPANPGATVLRTKGDTELPSWLANKTPRK